LGAAAQYWEYDPRAAKQLLTAAGFNLPLEATWTHWDATHGQTFVDTATLAIAQWREAGVANVKQNVVTFAQFGSTAQLGNYEGMGHITPGNFKSPIPCTQSRNTYWSPPEGVKAPSQNNGHVNDPRLSQLLEKQIGQFDREERKATFREIEELMADEQYRIILSTYTQTWFADPSVKNIQIPIFAYNGAWDYTRYWWFG